MTKTNAYDNPVTSANTLLSILLTSSPQRTPLLSTPKECIRSNAKDETREPTRMTMASEASMDAHEARKVSTIIRVIQNSRFITG